MITGWAYDKSNGTACGSDDSGSACGSACGSGE